MAPERLPLLVCLALYPASCFFSLAVVDWRNTVLVLLAGLGFSCASLVLIKAAGTRLPAESKTYCGLDKSFATGLSPYVMYIIPALFGYRVYMAFDDQKREVFIFTRAPQRSIWRTRGQVLSCQISTRVWIGHRF